MPVGQPVLGKYCYTYTKLQYYCQLVNYKHCTVNCRHENNNDSNCSTNTINIQLPGRGKEHSIDIINYKLQTQLKSVQELCESRGGRPELSVLTSLLASVDVKIY